MGQLAKSTLIISISTLVFTFAGYLTNIFLGRVLGPADYGIYGIVIVLMSNINIVQAYGLPQAVAKFASENNADSEAILKSGLIIQLVLSLLLAVLFFVLAPLIAKLLNDTELISYLRLASFIFPIYGVFALYTNYYNGLHQFERQAFMNIIYSLSKAFGIISLGLIFSVVGALMGFIVAPLVALFFGFRFPKAENVFPYKKLILFSFPLVGFAIALSLQQTIDLFFVKMLISGKEYAGYYTANQNISLIPYYALSALSVVIFPKIAKNKSLNLFYESHSLIKKALRVIVLILLPIMILLSSTSDQVISLLYSSDYIFGASSLSVLIFASGFLTVYALLANILNASHKPLQPLFISIIGVVMIAISCLLFIPQFGMVGASFATFIGALFSAVIAFFFVRRDYQIRIPFLRITKIATCGIILFIISYFFAVPVILLPIKYLVLLAIYLGLVMMVKEVDRKDIENVLKFLPVWIPFVNK